MLGRVGSYCGSVRYCDSDVWVTDNALVCRAKDPARDAILVLRAADLQAGRSPSRIGTAAAQSGEFCATFRFGRSRRRQRQRIAELLGALDDKIAANERVIEAAEKLMVAIAESVREYVPLSSLAERSTAFAQPGQFDDVVAHFSLPAFDDGAKPLRVARQSVQERQVRACPEPCVLFAKLNPRIPRIWNVVSLPSEMALASTEFVVLRPIGVDTSALWAAVRQPDVSRAAAAAGRRDLGRATSGSDRAT